MDAKVVLNVGRINYRKGLPFVASCIRELVGTVEADVHFVLAGPDERDGTLEKVREHLGAHVHRLHTPGPVYDEEKWALFASADLFVLASPFAENFGIVAAEALAMGTPAFVSPICGVGDHIDDTCGAVLPLEKSAWTDSMRDVLTGRQSFDRDVVAAAANPLELHRVVDRQVAVYEEILNAGT